MIKIDKVKMLGSKYDYYSSVKKKSDKIAEKVYNNSDEMFKAKLYDFALNICNQFIYDYTYIFTEQDLYFISDYNINIHELLNELKNDIIKMKKQEC